MAAASKRRRRSTLPIVGGIVQVLMLSLGLELLFNASEDLQVVVPMALWDLLGVLFLAGTYFLAWRQSRQPDPEPWFRPLAPGIVGAAVRVAMGWALALIPPVVSAIGLSAALIVLFQPGENAADKLIVQGMGAFTILLAWLTLHVSYAQRYAWLYHREGGGLEFPRTEVPVSIDFLYFALTLGSSFATSDVDVVSRQMRWHVLGHSVMSFFYNAVVLAVALKLITGG